MKRTNTVPVKTEVVREIVTEEKTTIVDDGVDAFTSLLGKEVVLFCAVYIYCGKLSGVNGENVMLTDAHIVYETGPFTNDRWKDAQKLPVKELYLQKGMIETFGEVVRGSAAAK